MPSFESLSEEDKEDIYAWLQTLDGPSDEKVESNGTGCNMRCKNRY